MSKTNIELDDDDWLLILRLIDDKIECGVPIEYAREYIRLNDKIAMDIKKYV